MPLKIVQRPSSSPSPGKPSWVLTHKWNDNDACSVCGFDMVGMSGGDGHSGPTCSEVRRFKGTCSVCGQAQQLTPHGVTCPDGHGDVDSLLEGEKPTSGPRRGIGALEQAIKHTRELKLAIPDAPVASDKSMLRLRLPDDISSHSLDDLGRLYGQFSSLASYAEVQVSMADVEQTEAENALENMQSIVTLRGVEGANAGERKAAVSQDPQVVRASEAYQIAHAKYVLLTALFNGYDRSMRTVSREFARRGIDVK